MACTESIRIYLHIPIRPLNADVLSVRGHSFTHYAKFVVRQNSTFI